MMNVSPNSRLVRVGIVAALLWVVSVTTSLADWREDQEIDEQMKAFDESALVQVLTTPPERPGGFEGPQPFDQEPPEAQGDFAVSPTCVVDPASGALICP